MSVRAHRSTGPESEPQSSAFVGYLFMRLRDAPVHASGIARRARLRSARGCAPGFACERHHGAAKRPRILMLSSQATEGRMSSCRTFWLRSAGVRDVERWREEKEDEAHGGERRRPRASPYVNVKPEDAEGGDARMPGVVCSAMATMYPEGAGLGTT